MSDLEQSDIVWSKNHFSRLREGAIWAVPKDGLIFQKRGKELILTAKMPYMDEMRDTITEEELAEQQKTSYFLIKQHFEAAGIRVKDET